MAARPRRIAKFPAAETVRRYRCAILGIGGIGVLVFVSWLITRPTSATTDDFLAQARLAFAQADYVNSQRLAEQHLATSLQDTDALIIAGDSAARQKRYRVALAFYERVADGAGSEVMTARFSAGLVYRELGFVSKAEERFKEVLSHDPYHLGAHNAMAHLLGFEGRSWEAVPHYLEPVRQGRFLLNHLLLLGSSAPIVQDATLEGKWLAVEPENTVPYIAEARHALFESGEPERAERLLRRVVAAAPHQLEAQARLGTLLLTSKEPREFASWHSRLPAEADEHPEIWVVRGAWAENRNQYATATRCYWEAVRRDPDHQKANYRLAQLLTRLGESDEAELFSRRSRHLLELSDVVNVVRDNPRDTSQMRKAVHLCEEMGRLWEAWAWCRIAEQVDHSVAWPRPDGARLAKMLHPDLPRTHPSAQPASEVDLSSYALPDWNQLFSDAKPVEQHVATQRVFRFDDVSEEVGLDFVYYNGSDPDAETSRMYEFNGGGVAVIDYDQDGWADIYFAQGSRWPPNFATGEHRDQFFRNGEGERFLDLSLKANVEDVAFSQGATTGDFNDDGFPDVYIANIGANRLLLNNGDGTFTDVTSETSTGGNEWTTSCLMADLNGDRWPDIYAVNYLSGEDVFTKTCRRPSGRESGCGPEQFAAAQDRLYLNLGDGRFEDVTATCGIEVAEGKGLGIAAIDLSGNGLLNLYIANDTTPNFYFVNTTDRPERRLSFTEKGALSGLAYDGQGLPQAGMGIGVSDADNDGLIDLFVTNYFREANTFYRQQNAESFQDDTRRIGLHEPGYLLLGFGTQFLDADLDGWSDLLVANGHVHNLADEGIPCRMPFQVFANDGGHFREISHEKLGRYFQREHLGRALAKLDWNRDGRSDFVVVNLNEPAALLTNHSALTGHFVTIHLRGIDSSRDAIGTTIWATTGERRWAHQLTAGDGYQASNQRVVQFGLGSIQQIDELKVRWPSGRENVFFDVSADREFVLIEKGGRLVPVK